MRNSVCLQHIVEIPQIIWELSETPLNFGMGKKS